MSQKRDVRRLNNESPVFRRLTASQDVGLGDIIDALLSAQANGLMSAAGLAIGTSSKAEVKVANTVFYVQDGSLKTKAGAEVAFTATDHDITGDENDDMAAVYAISISEAGVYTITKGASAVAGAEVAPATPAGHTLLGYVTITVASGLVGCPPAPNIFNATTDELDEAHLTDVYADAAPGALVGTPAYSLV